MDHQRIRSLDLLRALAIILVINAHTVLAFGAPPALAPLQLGGTGVDLFFVLSGWLLGRQLLRELSTHNTINLQRFWYRRWLRTLPAYYTVLFLTFLQQILLKSHPDIRYSYLYFLQNYHELPYFSISWSLCVEEHFYLLVGPFLLLLYRMRRLRWWLLTIVLGTPILCRLAGWYTTGEETHVRWDECAMGVCLAAINVFMPSLWKKLCSFAPLIALLGLMAYGLNFYARWHPELGIRDYDKVVYAIIFSSFILLGNCSRWWQTSLYVPGSSYIATRAYSLYLLHPEILALLKRFGHELPFPLFLLSAWIGSCVLAELLYRTVELPCMNLRERFSPSSSEPSKPLQSMPAS